MKNYEKELKELIALSHGGCEPVHQRATGMTEDQLRFLAGKGLISLKAAGNNEFWVIIEPAGLVYFSNKSEAREAWIKGHIVSFLSGFASGVLTTVVAAWLVQLLL